MKIDQDPEDEGDDHLQVQVPIATKRDLGQRSLDTREPIRMVVLRALAAYGGVNRRSIGTPYRRAKGTPLLRWWVVDAGRGFRAAGGVGRA